MREQAIEAAEVAYGEFNEKETIRLLEQIPGPFRGETVEKAILLCREQLERVAALRSEIHSRIKNKKIDGLSGKVQAYLALRPQDQAAHNLLKQLSGRDKSPIVFETVKRRHLGLRGQGKQTTPDIVYEVGDGHFKTYEIVPGSLHTISPAKPARFGVPIPFRPGETQDIPGKRASVKVKIKRKGSSKKREFILEKIQNREEVENAVASNQPNFDSPLEITYTNYLGDRKVFIAATNTIERHPNGIRVVVAPSAVPIFLNQEHIENWDDMEQFV